MGKFFYHEALKQGFEVFATSRNPDVHLPYVNPSFKVFFDLEQPRTWLHIPTPSQIVWCFPALPKEAASNFTKEITGKESRLLILGSTSAYPPKADGLTNEEVELNINLPRVQSEEHLRETYGAILVRFAGIYGPGRNVLNWIRRGKIKKTDRYVNLIHVKDIAPLCIEALRQSKPGSTYIVSDGSPRRWSDICKFLSTEWNIPKPNPTTPEDLGKRLSPQKILKELNYQLRHQDLYKELSEIERNEGGILESTWVE